MPTARSSFLAFATLALTASAGLAQRTVEWATPTDGDYAEPLNWFPGVVPTPTDFARLGGVGPYLVSLREGRRVGDLEIANVEAALIIRPRGDLTIGFGTPGDPGGGRLHGPGVLIVGDGIFTGPGVGLAMQAGAVVDGNLRLNSPDVPSRARLDPAHGVERGRIGPNGFITGRGLVSGEWFSEGLVSVRAGDEIRLVGSFTGGTLESADGGVIDLANTDVSGVVIRALPGEGFSSGPDTFLRDSIIEGSFTVKPDDQLVIGQGVRFDNPIRVGDGTEDGNASLMIEEGASLDGVVVLDGGGPAFRATVQPRSVTPPAVLAPTGVITGRGRILGPWVSQGLIEANAGDALELFGMFTGGTLVSRDGGILDLSDAVVSQAVLIAGPDDAFASTSRTLVRDSSFVGPFATKSGEAITFGPDVEFEQPLVINDQRSPLGSGVYMQAGATLRGDIILNGRAGVAGNAVLYADFSSFASIAPDARVSGAGRLSGSWRVAGTLAPGFGPDRTERFEPTNELTLRPSAVLELDIAGPDLGFGEGDVDQLDGSAAITVDGRLEVVFGAGFEPEPSSRFQIVRGRPVAGVFTHISVTGAGAAASVGPAHVVYTGDAAVLVLCAVDRDGDGELTIFDYLEFQNQFDAGDRHADLDGDGALTLFDFLFFQNRFDAGCD